MDINFDGKRTTDLVHEIPDLKNTYLQLQFTGENLPMYYSQIWINQEFFPEEKPIGYSPNVQVNFLRLRLNGTFMFENEGNTLQLSQAVPGNNNNADGRYALPESVTLSSNDIIEVVLKRTMYTQSGWVPMVIRVRYKRYRDDT